MANVKSKLYPLNQSCFYKLKNKKKLAAYLGCSLDDIKYLIKNNNYRTFTTKKEDKTRIVETPLASLKYIQKRIFNFLAKIEPPVYLHSGIKKHSHITNASQHLKKGKTFKLDIKKFFPSVTRYHVFNFFHKIMHCSVDVADILAEICTYNGHIPTGSPHSQIMAFYAHKKMFDEIYKISKENNLIMTDYVDDIAVTGDLITNEIKNLIRMIIKKSGLKNKKSKERLYSEGASKKITGIIIKNGEKRIPNKIHKEIHEKFHLLNNCDDKVVQKNILRKLQGKANYADQIKKTNWVKRIKEKEKKLLD